jgi:hypothetical protein
MATWKKVHVDSANTTHGTITATLADNSTSMTSAGDIHVVTVANDGGGSSQALTTRTISLGANAFNGTTIGTTTNALTDGAGIADFTFDGATGSVTVAVDIASATDLGSSVVGADSILVADANDSNAVKRCTISEAIAAVSSGVTSFTAGTNLTEDGNDTQGALVVNLDANLVDMASMSADHIAAGVTDGAGNDLTFNGGQGTGTGVGGDIFFKVAAVGAASASTVNALATALTIAAPTTASGNSTVTVAGDLVVSGATTTVSTTNLLVEDVFIRLAAEATADADTGIVFGGSAQKVFGWDNDKENGRFGVAYSGGDAAETDGFDDGEDFDGYMSVVHSASGAAAQVSAFNQLGNIYVDTSTDDIYIYS